MTILKQFNLTVDSIIVLSEIVFVKGKVTMCCKQLKHANPCSLT